MVTNVENLNLKENFDIPESMELPETVGTLNDEELKEARNIIETGGDTSKIKSLSPELAVLLLEKNKGENVVIDLTGLKDLDKKTAEVFLQFKGKRILLPDDINLGDDVLLVLLPVKSKLSIIEKLKKVERKINNSKKFNSKVKIFQEENEKTGKNFYWMGDKEDIKYDLKTDEIYSWGKSVEVKEITENNIRLKNLSLDLTWEEGIWLANYKNRFKHTNMKRVNVYGEPVGLFSKDIKYLCIAPEGHGKDGEDYRIRAGEGEKKGELDKFLPSCARDHDKLEEIVKWLEDKNWVKTEDNIDVQESMKLSGTVDTSVDEELDDARDIIETGGDTSKINRLSPRLAELLLEKSKGEVVIDLTGLKALNKKTAEVLSQFEGKKILLPDDINLDDDVSLVLLSVKSKRNIIEKLNEVESRYNNSEKINDKMKAFKKKIEETRSDLDWKEERGDIRYDWKTNRIYSWGKSVEVKEITENKIRLKYLNLDLTWEEGIWLANYKNRLECKDRRSCGIYSGSLLYPASKNPKYLVFNSSYPEGGIVSDTKVGELDKFLPNCAKDHDKLEEIGIWLKGFKMIDED